MSKTLTIPTGLAVTSQDTTQLASPYGMRLALSALLQWDQTGNPVKGVLPNPAGSLVVTADADEMKYHITAGGAVTGRTGQGAYIVVNPSAATIDTDPADGVNPRIDRIYIWQPDYELDDAGLAQVGVVCGDAAATPAVPDLPAGALELRRKLIAANASNTNDGAAFTNAAPYTGTVSSTIVQQTDPGDVPDGIVWISWS